MAIKKPGSRFTDRNRIRRMHKEGYSLQQIADTVSIIPEHVQYVIEQWDADEEKDRDKARQAALNAEAEARKAAQPANPAPNVTEEEKARIREAARRELMEERASEQKAAPVEEAPAGEEPEQVEKPKSRRRRKKAEPDDEAA